jgi:CBS domain-containing protein
VRVEALDGRTSCVVTPRTPVVLDVALHRPKVCNADATVAEIRQFFLDNHVHIALLVEDGILVGTLERADLSDGLSGACRAISAAVLEGRTIAPDASITEARRRLKQGRRRLAVVGQDSRLVGLLCVKSHGRGFCGDADVRERAEKKVDNCTPRVGREGPTSGQPAKSARCQIRTGTAGTMFERM